MIPGGTTTRYPEGRTIKPEPRFGNQSNLRSRPLRAAPRPPPFTVYRIATEPLPLIIILTPDRFCPPFFRPAAGNPVNFPIRTVGGALTVFGPQIRSRNGASSRESGWSGCGERGGYIDRPPTRSDASRHPHTGEPESGRRRTGATRIAARAGASRTYVHCRTTSIIGKNCAGVRAPIPRRERPRSEFVHSAFSPAAVGRARPRQRSCGTLPSVPGPYH
jgi:hypothetical protein